MIVPCARTWGRGKKETLSGESRHESTIRLDRLQWRSGPHAWGGVGVVQANVLAVAILSSSGNGVIAYDIVPQVDGFLLQGRWAYTSDTQVSTEILYRVRNGTIPGPSGSEEVSWEEKARRAFRPSRFQVPPSLLPGGGPAPGTGIR